MGLFFALLKKKKIKVIFVFLLALGHWQLFGNLEVFADLGDIDNCLVVWGRTFSQLKVLRDIVNLVIVWNEYMDFPLIFYFFLKKYSFNFENKILFCVWLEYQQVLWEPIHRKVQLSSRSMNNPGLLGARRHNSQTAHSFASY
jgi:hypothetical protein